LDIVASTNSEEQPVCLSGTSLGLTMVRREQLFWVFVVYCRLDFKQKFLSLHGMQGLWRTAGSFGARCDLIDSGDIHPPPRDPQSNPDQIRFVVPKQAVIK